MSVGWSSLPLVPLRCVLDVLSVRDALAATAVCRHWRAAVLLYEGRKDTLKLRVKQLEKNTFLARVFRKHVKRLQVYIDGNAEDLDNFMTYVLPQFFDTLQLKELLFIGPNFSTQNQHLPIVKLNRILIESLVFKHMDSLQKLALFGCEMDIPKRDSDRYTHKHLEQYSRALTFSASPSAADSVLCVANAELLVFSTLQHIMVDYEQINTASLETLSRLSMFTNLTVSIRNKRNLQLEPIDWHRLRDCYPSGLDVAVHIIGLPYRRFNEVIENVLVEGMTLTALKVMFCKTLYTPLLTHVVRVHKASLRELVWADAPYDSIDAYHRVVRPARRYPYDTCNVNPFILLCWQCVQLRRLVIHGYWIWQYDVLGFVRLRKTLEQLEISAIYSKQGRFTGSFQQSSDNVVRVLAVDSPRTVDQEYIHQVNAVSALRWEPAPWSALHPALRARASAASRAHYALREATRSRHALYSL